MRTAPEAGLRRPINRLPNQSTDIAVSEYETTSAVEIGSEHADLNSVDSGAPSPVYRTGAGSEDRLLRATEIQRELGVSRATAYRMMTDGTLPTYRFGGRGGRRMMIRVSLKELRSWIAARRTLPSGVA